MGSTDLLLSTDNVGRPVSAFRLRGRSYIPMWSGYASSRDDRMVITVVTAGKGSHRLTVRDSDEVEILSYA